MDEQGKEDEEDVDEQGKDGEEDADRGAEQGKVDQDYEDLFRKQKASWSAIPDHEALRMIIKNQSFLRKQDQIPPHKFSPFILEFTTNMITLQRSTMLAIQNILKSHQEIYSGLMMFQTSKYTGLEFLDSSERKKKNWLSIAIKNYTERVIGKNLK